MRSPILTTLLGSWLLFSAAQAVSQDLQIFDVEDFVDPALLKPLGQGSDAKAFGSLLLLSGIGRNLQIRSDTGKGDFTFAHLAGDIYYGNWQFGLDAIDISRNAESARFGERLSLEAGRYFTSKTYVNQKKERPIQVRYVTRALLRWDWEERPHGEIGHAASLDVDIRRDGPRAGAFDPIGGYSYTWVQAGEGDKGYDRHYLSLGFRTPIAAYNNGGNVLMGMGVGIESIVGRFRWGAPRLELSGELPVRSWGKVRLSWAPTYQLDQGVFKQEYAILFIPPLLARFFSPGRHSLRPAR
ncbi:MAG TPA: hypothetical protein VGS07_27075 [Thermoanaerobaculia bacterium]|jgi:hypothetical protein|nr:hypothetical protein [Thermoanaerobaculia bacterium]